MGRKFHPPRTPRERRHVRVRGRVVGTGQRPRLCIFRSLQHIYAQVIDDGAGHTLVAASSVDADIRPKTGGLKKQAVAELVGALVAQRALERGIREVVFDRGGYRYHGRVRAVADGARKEGLGF
ncbi:MAG: 50S ribosomal protein L18 [Chloroflexi bacterium]|nr:50S ribosomal protein L18 [Chloroflexota bacterium]